jgi:uncharacterized membrane protein
MTPYLVIGGFLLGFIVIGALVGQALWLRSLDTLIKESIRATGEDIAALNGRLTRRPRVRADEDAIILEWRAAMERLPEDSPRRAAYENRLRSLGALGGN